MIATDHAPHTAEEKSRGFDRSLNGITGLECAFPVLYTGLVQTGVLTMEQLSARMSAVPRARFGIAEPDSYVIIDTAAKYTIRPSDFLSMGTSTPFEGREVSGRILMTICDGRIVYEQ